MKDKKSNVVDFAAFRKKRELEGEGVVGGKTDTLKTETSTAAGDLVGKKVPTEPKEHSRFLGYMGTDETKHWWVRAGIQLELGIPALLEKIERATQGKFSPRSLMENIKLVESYTDDEIMDYLKNSDEKKWQQKPTFYRALMIALQKRL